MAKKKTENLRRANIVEDWTQNTEDRKQNNKKEDWEKKRED